MSKKTRNMLIGVVLVLVMTTGLIYVIPRTDSLRARIYYFFNPPEDVSFLPNDPTQATPTSSLASLTLTSTTVPTDLATPTPSSTPIPQMVKLDDFTFTAQMNRWNYCGPANLSMALSFWGWEGIPGRTTAVRDQIASVVKPGENNPDKDFIQSGESDVNVMPYEMVDYVNDHTTYRALYRYGGDLDLIKRLLAAGFPVITEKGIYELSARTKKLSWMGHYAFTTGYDESQQIFYWQDSNTSESDPIGLDETATYVDYANGWRAFNYVFIVVYPAEREADLLNLLGPWADWDWAARHSVEVAEQEIPNLTGNDLFFAWYNKGTGYSALTDYGQSAVAYDYALGTVYESLPDDDNRPYRIFWYQTGPYKAYYFTSDYDKVIQIADAAISTTYTPIGLEETLYYRALAEAALGLYDAAYADIRQSVYFNRNFQLALDVMAQWGLTP